MSDPQPTPPAARKPWFRLSARAAWVIAAAIGIGLLLFVALWMDDRNDSDFYRPGQAPPRADGQAFEPLPSPPPVNRDRDPGLPDANRDAPLRRIDEILPPQPAPPPAPEPAPAPQPDRPYASASNSPPVPIEMPAPRYPPESMSRGESGEVLLEINVDPAGRPHSMDIVRSSGSRYLDRAALVAARSWRFRPAMRDGQPVSGTVNVPVRFDGRR